MAAYTKAQKDFLIDKFTKGKINLPAFREHILENPEEERLTCAPFHFEWSDILLKETGHFCIEGYRESAKTQYILRAFPLYNLVYPEKSRRYVLFVCRNQETAEKRLKDIKNEYKANALLNARLGKISEDSAAVFQISVFDNNGSSIIVRYEAHGKAGSIRGASWGALRPQLIVMDDLQNKDDMDSERALERDWDWFLDDVLPLTSKGRIFYISNNLGEKCIAERIFAAKGYFGPTKQFTCRKVSRTSALDLQGTPSWPSKDNQPDILAERDAFALNGRASIWMRNNMCECVAAEDKVFQPEWFHYYPVCETENLARSCNIFCRCDLGLTSKDTADYCAFVVVGVNELNYWYVLDVHYGRYSLSERVDKVFEINRLWEPMNFGIENAAGSDLIIGEVNKQMPVRNNFVRDLFECTHGGKKKELRIQAMQPRFSSGSVWFPDEAPWLAELQHELSMFTMLGLTTVHDDLMDALAYCEQKTYAPVNNPGNKKRTQQNRNRPGAPKTKNSGGARCRIG